MIFLLLNLAPVFIWDVVEAPHDDKHVVDADGKAEERDDSRQGGVVKSQRHRQSHPDRDPEEYGQDSGGRQVKPDLDVIELAQRQEGVEKHEGVPHDLPLGVVFDGLAGLGDEAEPQIHE